MDNKKIIAIVILGIFVLGGLGMLFSGHGGEASSNTQQQSKESYEEMMARMHPSQQVKNDMSGHHSKSPINDNLNMD